MTLLWINSTNRTASPSLCSSSRSLSTKPLLGRNPLNLTYKKTNENCRKAENSTEKNYYDGFLGAGALFLLISALTFPNGPFIRPHPILWRVIFGLSVIYVIVLQFALFQSFDDLKKVLFSKKLSKKGEFSVKN